MIIAEDYKNGEKIKSVAKLLAKEADTGRNYRFMDFCGGHTYVLAKNALEDLLPANITMIHGPGCPVCILPAARISVAIKASLLPDVVFCTYGDVMRVPNAKGESLFTAKAQGADIRMVYSVLDALQVARENPKKNVIFMAIGFETTAPTAAAAILEAKKEAITNFFILSNQVLTTSAMQAVLAEGVPLDGIVAPGHVCMVTGLAPFAKPAEKYRKPMVVTGFEPLDMMLAILMLVRQVNKGGFALENEYRRALAFAGNAKAMAALNEVFSEGRDFKWRGLGVLPESSFALNPVYAIYDAEAKWDLPEIEEDEPKACECSEIIKGLKKPPECPLFGKVCRPENPVGACMVSGEGTCAAYYKYRRIG
ncbi:MAG: hydrogenase formation protein HypD [Alphaproteobacteria bacterium]|nr:hydrogenase formation protein HypD [Alphaproteobacteria bacterium]